MHEFVHVREQGRRQDAGLVGGDEDGGHPEYGEDAEPSVGSGWLWVGVVHMGCSGIVSLGRFLRDGYRIKSGMMVLRAFRGGSGYFSCVFARLRAGAGMAVSQ